MKLLQKIVQVLLIPSLGIVVFLCIPCAGATETAGESKMVEPGTKDATRTSLSIQRVLHGAQSLPTCQSNHSGWGRGVVMQSYELH